MENNYEKLYNDIELKLAGTMCLAEKRVRYKLLEIEIEERESSSTKIVNGNINNDAVIYFSFVTIVLSILTTFNYYLDHEKSKIFMFLFIFIAIIVVGISLFVLDYLRNRKNKKRMMIINKEKQEILELKIMKIVIENLAIEENNRSL